MDKKLLLDVWQVSQKQPLAVFPTQAWESATKWVLSDTWQAPQKPALGVFPARAWESETRWGHLTHGRLLEKLPICVQVLLQSCCNCFFDPKIASGIFLAGNLCNITFPCPPMCATVYIYEKRK